jgi:Na+-transporting methylmalonyl-CoA/oxaloacetate decarboxylase gamma subunit
MEHALDLIEKGQAGFVTAMGMGGVFTALIFLFLFIVLLGKLYRFKKVRSRKAAEPAPRPPSEPDNAETVAALAVALALADQGRRSGVSVPPSGEEEPSAWKMAGRLSMMRPFTRPKKD